MPAPMRLPIRPPIAAPASPAAMRSPVPPPNWEPIRPPATAPTSVPVFSLGPVPVEGSPLHAAVDSATSAAALRRTKNMIKPPSPGDPRKAGVSQYPCRRRNLIAKNRAKLCSAAGTAPSRAGHHQLGAQPADGRGAERQPPAVEARELDHDGQA